MSNQVYLVWEDDGYYWHLEAICSSQELAVAHAKRLRKASKRELNSYSVSKVEVDNHKHSASSGELVWKEDEEATHA